MLLLPRPFGRPHYHRERNNMAEETKEAASSKAAPKKGAKKRSAKKKASAKKGTAEKKSLKKRARGGINAKGEKVNLTEFILQFPESVKPKEIVEKAKAQGLTIKAEYASTQRTKAKNAGTWLARFAVGSQRTSAASAKSSGNDAEWAFRRAARGITLDRAKAILDEIAAAYEGT